ACADLAPCFRRRLEEEFIDPSGRFIACRSSLTGLGFPMLGGVMPQALPCFFLNALLPEIARRQWALLRSRLLAGGRLVRRNFWPIDIGNYSFSRASAYAATMLSAVEMGDGDVARLCRAALDSECPASTDGAVSWRD